MKKHFSPIFFLSIVAFLLGLVPLRYGYLLEDYKYLRSYSLPEITQTFYSHWEPTQEETRAYRPFHAVHYAFFYWLIGGSATANHLLQAILFIAAIWLIYAVAFRCSENRRTGFWVAFFYCCLSTNAWQISWLNHRHHILQLQLFLLSFLAFDQYLKTNQRTFWGISFIFFTTALLFKEEVFPLPIFLALYAIMFKYKTCRELIKPILPFIILMIIFLGIRAAVIRTLPADHPHPPPISLISGQFFLEYFRSLISTLVQAYGTYDPANIDFPLYGSGIPTWRTGLSLVSLLVFFMLGGLIWNQKERRNEKKIFLFGLIIFLIGTALVAAWYRNNRLYISSIGIAIMAGTMAEVIFRELKDRFLNFRLKISGAVASLFLLIYLSTNLFAFFELQNALRPLGRLSLTWDRWVYEGYLPWMKPEQIEIFREKLMSSARQGWAEKLPRSTSTEQPISDPGQEKVTFGKHHSET